LSRAGWLALIGVFVTIGVAFAVALMSCERRAEPREPGSIEPVMQETWTDCGPAAVTMSLTVHGRDATLASVKKAMPAQEDGVTAFDIVELAKKEGMGAVGIRIDVSEAASVLQLGDILHVNASHFVVFEQFDTEGFHVLDPSEGRRTAPLSDFANEFSGVALLFADSPAALEARLARHRFP
jgi:ABC-type bacteriocin/lantibiotic exporter with double-glycine peptidase domain